MEIYFARKNNKSNAEDTIKWILAIEMKYKKLKNPCKEMLEKGLCLGCNKLENFDFEGDDKCEYAMYVFKRSQKL